MIDSSAVLAILLDEPERPTLIRKLAADPVRLMSVVPRATDGRDTL